MATATENALRIDNIVNNTKKLSLLSTSEKRSIIDAIFPTGVQMNYTNVMVSAGDHVYGKDPSLFGGDNFLATVVTAPPTLESHFSDIWRY